MLVAGQVVAADQEQDDLGRLQVRIDLGLLLLTRPELALVPGGDQPIVAHLPEVPLEFGAKSFVRLGVADEEPDWAGLFPSFG